MTTETIALPTAEQLRSAHAAAQKACGLFTLPLRHKSWRGGSGDFAGHSAGSSLDFHDHREYAPGDDPRHLNWQAYARTGNFTMKQFREEVRPTIDILLDASPSMWLTPAKSQRTLELFYFAHESAHRVAASVRTWLLTSEQSTPLAPEALHAHSWAATITTHGAASLPPAIATAPLRAQSLRVLISDLLYPGSPDPTAAALCQRQGRGLILAPTCSEEAQPAWDGNTQFHDVESRLTTHRRVEPALLQRYHLAYARHFTLWKTSAQRLGIALARVDATPPLSRALQSEALTSGALELLS